MALFSLHFNPIERTARNNISTQIGGTVQATTRLATGLRVNSAKDDPAAFIGAELLKSENTEIKAQIKANRQIGNRLAVKETYLASIGNLLSDLKGAIVEGSSEGTLSDDQVAALQLQIDYVVDAIQRISNTASFKGEKLFDGLFGSLGSSNGWDERDGTMVLGEEYRTLSCSNLQTDALRNLVLHFSGGDEQQEFFLGATALLNRIAINAGAETLTISTERIPADQTLEDTSETVDIVAETTAETENVEEEAVAEEAAVTDAELPVETPQESETSEERVVETEAVAEAAVAAETEEFGTEEEASASEEKAEKNTATTSNQTTDPYGGYVFRSPEELGFLYEEKPEEEDRAVRFDVGFSMASLQSGISNLLLQRVTFSTTSGCSSCLDEKTDSLKNSDEETEDEEDEEFLSGTLADLRSGGAASLKNDPARADQIVRRAISFIAMQRAEVGAEIKYTVNVNISMLQDRLYQNESAIADLVNTDYAVETSNLARHQILLQTSMKALQISREIPRMLLSILNTGYNSLARS